MVFGTSVVFMPSVVFMATVVTMASVVFKRLRDCVILVYSGLFLLTSTEMRLLFGLLLFGLLLLLLIVDLLWYCCCCCCFRPRIEWSIVVVQRKATRRGLGWFALALGRRRIRRRRGCVFPSHFTRGLLDCCWRPFNRRDVACLVWSR